MTAPRWIVETIASVNATYRGPGIGVDVDDGIVAAALLERLPLEAMGAALALPIARLRDVVHRLRETSERAPDVRAVPMRLVHQAAFDELIAYVGSGDCGRLDEVVRALAADHDVVTIAELYQGATRALDAAGVPYAVNTSEVYRPLDLAGRITWLAQQRPTRLELQRVEARVDAELAAKQKAIDDAAKAAEQQRDAWQRRYDECIVTITANQQSIAALIDESETRRREVEATRRQATAAADDLDRERRAHQDAMGDAAATELRLQAERDSARHAHQIMSDQVDELRAELNNRDYELTVSRRDVTDLTKDRDYWQALAEVRAAALVPG